MAYAALARQDASTPPKINPKSAANDKAIPPAPRAGFKLTVEQILERYPVARSTLNAWIADGLFPKPVKIGGRVFFDEQDIADFERKAKA